MQQTSPKPRHRVRRSIAAVVAALTLSAGGGTAWALNRYVIDHVEISNVSAYEAAHSSTAATPEASNATASDATTTATTYDSDGADITISTVTTGSGDSTV